jgi:membrane protease YdiL (CAAX protease family)
MHIMPLAVIFAILLGVWFGVIAWRTNSIGPTIACHAFVNGGLNAWRMVVKFGEIPETYQRVVEIGFLVVGAICFVLTLVLLVTNGKPADRSESVVRSSDNDASV